MISMNIVVVFMFPHQFSVPLVASIALEGCDAPRYGDPDNIPVIEAVQVQYLRLTRENAKLFDCHLQQAPRRIRGTKLQREQRHGRRGRRLPGHLGNWSGRQDSYSVQERSDHADLSTSPDTVACGAVTQPRIDQQPPPTETDLAWTRIRTHSFGRRSDSGDHWNQWNLNQLLERFQNGASY